MKLAKYIFFIFFLLNTTKVKAQCDFITGEHIDKLNDPNEIKSLGINIPKSKKYAINQLKILTSKSKNIPPQMRKKFDAEVFINYKFGSCKHIGKVWQNGDWKDHIKMINGKIISSLNVKLISGNILNSVKFKLLIPETRNHLNEILGSIILKKHNFIVPETFEIQTAINNVSSLMIFQEDSQKELLERNKRREGPIFEGDESLLWSNKDNDELVTGPSLARLINYRASFKGENTLNIYLNSYDKLQNYYINSNYFVDPNLSSKLYQNYLFLMLSMNGHHGLFKSNQKHYFNLLSKNFEPIYYDGNFDLNSGINKVSTESIISSFSNKYSYPYLNKYINEAFLKETENIFKSKVKKYNSKKKRFLKNAISQIKANQKLLSKLIEKNNQLKEDTRINRNFSQIRSKFIEENRDYKKNLFFITSYKIDDKGILFFDNFGKKNKLSFFNFSKILSRKKYEDKSFIFLPTKNSIPKKPKLLKTSIALIGVDIFHHPENIPLIDLKNKSIALNNFDNNYPTLISNGYLRNWKISYSGQKNVDFEKKKNVNGHQERVNYYGYTGCLNFLNTTFDNTDIISSNGKCEDSINIVNSKGKINNLIINNSFQDGLDVDFSNLKILNASINAAGNDCVDFSSGDYDIKYIFTSNCFDKSISAGEKSILNIDNLNSEKSNIGIAVKDLSKVNLQMAKILSSKFCISAYQKKQEFGGAFIKVNRIECDGKYFSDKNSLISL